MKMRIREWGSWGITIVAGTLEIEASKEKRSITGTGRGFRFSTSIRPAEVFDRIKSRYFLIRRGKR
jgi:hypothetical protein